VGHPPVFATDDPGLLSGPTSVPGSSHHATRLGVIFSAPGTVSLACRGRRGRPDGDRAHLQRPRSRHRRSPSTPDISGARASRDYNPAPGGLAGGGQFSTLTPDDTVIRGRSLDRAHLLRTGPCDGRRRTSAPTLMAPPRRWGAKIQPGTGAARFRPGNLPAARSHAQGHRSSVSGLVPIHLLRPRPAPDTLDDCPERGLRSCTGLARRRPRRGLLVESRLRRAVRSAVPGVQEGPRWWPARDPWTVELLLVPFTSRAMS